MCSSAASNLGPSLKKSWFVASAPPCSSLDYDAVAPTLELRTTSSALLHLTMIGRRTLPKSLNSPSLGRPDQFEESPCHHRPGRSYTAIVAGKTRARRRTRGVYDTTAATAPLDTSAPAALSDRRERDARCSSWAEPIPPHRGARIALPL